LNKGAADSDPLISGSAGAAVCLPDYVIQAGDPLINRMSGSESAPPEKNRHARSYFSRNY